MTQPTSVVIPVYDGVTQLDFTGPHQFLSRTPDLHVRVASLGGQTATADRLTFSNLEELGAIESCDVLLGLAAVAASPPSRMTYLSDCTARGDRALSDFGLYRVAHFGCCRISCRTSCGLPLGLARIAPGLRCRRR